MEKRNHVVEKASSKCNSLLAATIERDFKYGDTGGRGGKNRQEKKAVRKNQVLCPSGYMVFYCISQEKVFKSQEAQSNF